MIHPGSRCTALGAKAPGASCFWDLVQLGRLESAYIYLYFFSIKFGGFQMFQLIQLKETLEAMQTAEASRGGTCTGQMIRFSWGGTYRGHTVDLDPAIQIGDARISVARGYQWNR